MSRSPDTAPGRPARAVATNTTDTDADQAPPTVSLNPSADTRGDAGTGTDEGPSRPKVPLPDETTARDHQHRVGTKTDTGVDDPGPRVDDEHDTHSHGRMTRQE